MAKLLNIGFEYKGCIHYSLIRVKEKEDWVEYQVTVMDGNLEKLLYGSHIIKEVNGQLEMDLPDDNEKRELKTTIAQSLNTYLQEHSNLSSDQYVGN